MCVTASVRVQAEVQVPTCLWILDLSRYRYEYVPIIESGIRKFARSIATVHHESSDRNRNRVRTMDRTMRRATARRGAALRCSALSLLG